MFDVLVIVEGIDLTGKTTLCERLNNKLHGDILHASAPTMHPLDEYVAPIADYDFDHSVILDRWHLGESVWPAVYGRTSDMNNEVQWYIELFLLSRGALVVLAEGSELSIINRLSWREGENITAEQVPDIIHRFKSVAQGSLLPIVPYDFERDKWTIVNDIISRADLESDDAYWPSHVATPRWVGYPRPDVLYVGEQVADAPDTRLGLPLMPYPNTSGNYLLRALPASRPAIVNALAPNSSVEPLDTLWEALGEPAIVALGNVAHGVLSKFGLTHGVAPHPQYVRRFFSRSIPDGYRELLRLARDGEDTRGMINQQ